MRKDNKTPMHSTQTPVLQELFELQRQYTNFFFDRLDLEQVEKVLRVCVDCEGLIVLTGVGKSGIVAEKIAMTLMSMGNRALYLPAANFLHGDIGGISSEDVVIFLSKSGETAELINVTPHLRRKKSKIITVTSTTDSSLARVADLSVYLPVEKELCAFDLAPTTSTAVQLLFGDLLAVAIGDEKGVSLEDYAENHPAGAIGKKVTLFVRDLMRKGDDLPICSFDDRLVDVIVLLSDKRCGCLVITSKENNLLGIFTDGDLRRALQKEGPQVLEKKMGDLMNPTPLSVASGDLAHQAMQKMQSTRYVMVAPVIEKEKFVGLIRMHDIVHEGI